MTNKEAIEILRIAQSVVEWEYPMDYAVAIEMGIAALEFQEPKKPYTHVVSYPYKPDETIVQCPICNRRLRTKRTMAKGDKHCPDCGQAILWEGIE